MQRRSNPSLGRRSVAISTSQRRKRLSFDALEDRRLLTTPTISIAPASVTASRTATTAETFTVSLSAASTQVVSVNYTTANGSATSSRDYVAVASHSLVFQPGQTQQTFSVTVDAAPRYDLVKSFYVNLSQPSNGILLVGQASGTIQNPNPKPVLSISDGVKIFPPFNSNGNFDNSFANYDESFIITLSSSSNVPTTVTYATINGTASAGFDYFGISSTSVILAPGQTQLEVLVKVQYENTDTNAPPRDPLTFSLDLQSSLNATINPSRSSGAGLVFRAGGPENPDPNGTLYPNISVIPPASQIASSTGTVVVMFRVQLSAVVDGTTVDYNTVDGSAVAGTDYVGLPTQSHLFGVDDHSVDEFGVEKSFIDIPVTILPQTTYGPPKTFTFELSNPTGGVIATNLTAATILNPRSMPVASMTDATVNASANGSTSATFTVNLSAASTLPATINYSTADGTAHAGTDYTAVPVTPLAFSPGQTQQTFTVPINPQTADSLTKTFKVNLSSLSNVMVTAGQVTGTIVDPAPQPGVSITSTSVNASSTDNTVATFTISLSAASSLPTTVQYATANGSALAGTDYTAVSLTTLTFTAGQTRKTVTVAIKPEPADGHTKTFTLNLSNPSNATITTAQATGTIVDPIPPPGFSVTGMSVNASLTASTTVTFTVGLSSASQLATTVKYVTADGTALAGIDYTAIPLSTLTFAAGQTQKTITVPIKPEPADSHTKTFTLTLSSPNNATIATAQATGTIVDPSPLPVASITGTSVNASLTGNTTATFTISLSAASSLTTTVKYATANGTALVGTDYTSVPLTLLTFSPGQTQKTVTVAIKPEPADARTKTFTVTLSSPSNSTISTAQATGTIVDPLPVASITGTSVNASLTGNTTATFTISLSAASSLTTTVKYATANGTALVGTDYTSVPLSTLTFNPGQTQQTITVSIKSEPADSRTKTFTVALSSPINATISTAQATGTIVDPQNVQTVLPLALNPAPFGSGNANVFTAEVNGAYNLILGRAADPQGASASIAALQSGMTMSQLASNLLLSAEYAQRLVIADYQSYLGRTPSSKELSAVVALVGGGLSVEQLAQALLGSPEFSQLHAANSDFVATSYHLILGREASAGEISAVSSVLTSGLSRGGLIQGLLGSPEADIRSVNTLYTTILGRSSDDGGRQACVQVLQAGVSLRDLAIGFFGTPEFQNRAKATVK